MSALFIETDGDMSEQNDRQTDRQTDIYSYILLYSKAIDVDISCIFSVPNSPQNLVVLSSTESSLTFKWTAPGDGVLTGYSVNVALGSSTVHTRTTDKDTTTLEITGLHAGRGYNVSVVTLNGERLSAEEEDTLYTRK